MKITIIAVGKLKEKYLKDGIAEYTKRLSRFCEIGIIEVDDEKAPESLSAKEEEQIKKKEGDRVKARIKEGSYVIALDVKGSRLDSESFAGKLKDLMVSGVSSIYIIIGGSIGMDTELTKRADFRLSISDMTFPHQLIRLILTEQLYRAFKIINGEVYHK